MLAIEQCLAHEPFQCLHPAAQGRSRQSQFLGGGLHRSESRNLNKGLQSRKRGQSPHLFPLMPSLQRIMRRADPGRSEEHTSELQSLMRISYAVFCLKKKTTKSRETHTQTNH